MPIDAQGKKKPKVFCCLYHRGQWVFHCDFEDFEREFSFKYELKMFEVASKMEEGEVISAEQLEFLSKNNY